MRLLVFAAWVSVGCRSGSSPDQGTVVGNPGESKLTVAAGTEGEIARARTHVAAIEWESCSGDVVATEIDAEMHLMDDDPIEMNSILDDVNREPPKTAEADAEAIVAATPEETADEDTSTDDADPDKAAAPKTSGEVSS